MSFASAISGVPWNCPNQSKIRINPHSACAVHQSINMRKYSCRNLLSVHPSTIQMKVLTLRMRLGCMVSITRKAPSKEFSIDVCPTFLQSLQLHHITARIHVNNFQTCKRKTAFSNQINQNEKPHCTLACSSSSKRRTPAPSPMTKPSRSFKKQIKYQRHKMGPQAQLE